MNRKKKSVTDPKTNFVRNLDFPFDKGGKVNWILFFSLEISNPPSPLAKGESASSVLHSLNPLANL